ncbi:MAG: dephospho-CoA kinase [bacterium]|nr:dephospho-CoA kinase [bacterium]
MMVFGITGGTGAGKSSVSEIFRQNGVYVIDADKTARAVVEPGREALKELCACFGNKILGEDGRLKRHELADIVFADEKKLEMLNSITHKYIYREIKSELLRKKTGIAAIDAAVLIGSGIEKMCVFIVSVIADEKIRLRRIMERDGISAQSAQSRINAQPPAEFYIKHSKYIIHNNGTQKELEREAREVLEKIKEFSIE